MIVNTSSLRVALRAVLPHVSTDEEGSLVLTSARVIANEGGVEVVATDRFTAAAATVDCPSPENLTFDLSVDQIKKVLAMFRPPKDLIESAELDIELTDDGKSVVITDVCGMFPGDSMTLSGISAEDGFPDVRRAMASMMGSPLTSNLADVNPGFLARLKAAEAYGPLTMAHGDKAVWFVTESFTCVIMVARTESAGGDDEWSAKVSS